MTSDAVGAGVFVSYSRKDGEIAERLQADLIAAGFAAYLDKHDIAAGEPWRERLGDLISGAEKVVFLISPDSVASEICAWEVDHAERLAKSILPILVRETPTQDVPGRLSRLNYVFMRSADEHVASLPELVKALKLDLEWEREKTRINDGALTWDGAERPQRLLMYADDVISSAELWRDRHPASAPAPTETQLSFISISRQRRTVRQRRLLLGTFAALAITSVVAVFAWFQRDLAIEQRQQADRRAALLTSDAAEIRATSGETDAALLMLLNAAESFEADSLPHSFLIAFQKVLERATRERRYPLPDNAVTLDLGDGLYFHDPDSGAFLKFDGQAPPQQIAQLQGTLRGYGKLQTLGHAGLVLEEENSFRAVVLDLETGEILSSSEVPKPGNRLSVLGPTLSGHVVILGNDNTIGLALHLNSPGTVTFEPSEFGEIPQLGTLVLLSREDGTADLVSHDLTTHTPFIRVAADLSITREIDDESADWRSECLLTGPRLSFSASGALELATELMNGSAFGPGLLNAPTCTAYENAVSVNWVSRLGGGFSMYSALIPYDEPVPYFGITKSSIHQVPAAATTPDQFIIAVPDLRDLYFYEFNEKNLTYLQEFHEGQSSFRAPDDLKLVVRQAAHISSLKMFGIQTAAIVLASNPSQTRLLTYDIGEDVSYGYEGGDLSDGTPFSRRCLTSEESTYDLQQGTLTLLLGNGNRSGTLQVPLSQTGAGSKDIPLKNDMVCFTVSIDQSHLLIEYQEESVLVVNLETGVESRLTSQRPDGSRLNLIGATFFGTGPNLIIANDSNIALWRVPTDPSQDWTSELIYRGQARLTGFATDASGDFLYLTTSLNRFETQAIVYSLAAGQIWWQSEISDAQYLSPVAHPDGHAQFGSFVGSYHPEFEFRPHSGPDAITNAERALSPHCVPSEPGKWTTSACWPFDLRGFVD